MMGGKNVRAVMALYPKLTHADMRLLVHMASIALDPAGAEAERTDGKVPCLYYGSTELQAQALGYYGINADRLLRKIRGHLITAGAIVKVRSHARRRSPTWLVVTGEEPLISHHPEEVLPWLSGTSRT
jgi:predicted hotdog family 3-hydroxylacyl-ACP dehydratase